MFRAVRQATIYVYVCVYTYKLRYNYSATVSTYMVTFVINTLRTGDADLRFYVTTVQDG